MRVSHEIHIIGVCISHDIKMVKYVYIDVFLLQGMFTHWLSQSPLRKAHWYDPSSHHIMNLTTHTLTFGKYSQKKRIHLMDLNVEQPDISYLNNCTAAIPHTNFVIYPWISVDCDTKYEAMYVCQELRPKSNVQSISTSFTMVHNRTCEGDWFMINGSVKCFSVFWPESSLSFYDAQRICSAQNASMFTVHGIHRNLSHGELEMLQTGVNVGLRISRQTYEYSSNLNSEDLPTILLGKSLSPKSLTNIVPYMINSLAIGSSNNFYADMNNSCNVIDQSVLSMLMNAGESSMETKTWGVKCRSCSEPLNITGVICERESKPYNIECQNKHFTCKDETCILSIYQCDLESDCFDASDEENCLNKKNNFSNELIILSFLQSDISGRETNTEIRLHTLCDGIYSNVTFSQEKDACLKNKLYQIHFLDDKKKVFKSKKFTLQDTDISDMYLQEKRSCLRYNRSSTTIRLLKDMRQYSRHIPVYKAPGDEKVDRCYKMNQICNIGLNKPVCKLNNYECKHFVCPGMFKCHNDYCIYMSNVCNGQYDCKEGDDEMICPIKYCPGLLKCRGENRCVSKEEICDNTVNCLHSMDDEIGCYKCPGSCQCNGYSVKCNVENTLEDILSIGINNIKGLILTGIQQKLHVHNLHINGLIYINISFCHTQKILVLHQNSLNTFILIADFKYNELMVVNFLKAHVFKNLLFLDLSFNYLTTLKYGVSFFLTKLFMLSIAGNPMKAVLMSTTHHKTMLTLIDMRSIYDYTDLQVSFSRDMHIKLHVKVSELMMCCIVHKDIKCTSDGKTKLCTGLIHSYITKVFFYFMSCMNLFLSLVTLTWHSLDKVYRKPKQKLKNERKKYYSIILLNYVVAALLNSIYLFGVFLADVVKVNLFVWILSPLCLFLSLILYNSLVVVVIFKVAFIVFVSLQIIYPFKHQCTFLKWTALMCFLVWLVVSSSSALTSLEQSPFQDKLCSLGKCSQNNQVLLFVACFTDILFICCCILPISKTYLILKTNSSKVQSTQSDSRNITQITMKIAAPIISEIPLQLCLLGLLAVKLADYRFSVFCEAIFLFAIPMSMSLSLLLMILK